MSRLFFEAGKSGAVQVVAKAIKTCKSYFSWSICEKQKNSLACEGSVFSAFKRRLKPGGCAPKATFRIGEEAFFTEGKLPTFFTEDPLTPFLLSV